MAALLGALAWLDGSRRATFLVPPFGAMLAILLYLPNGRISQPPAVVCGSVLGAAIGTALTALLGANAGTAVGAAVAAMLILCALDVFHPPGVALAMYPPLLRPGWLFSLEVVLPFTLVAIASAPLARGGRTAAEEMMSWRSPFIAERDADYVRHEESH
jgi:CBS-domain-containing membrane protein